MNMKKHLATLIMLVMSLSIFAQAPLHPVKIYNHAKVEGDINNADSVYLNFTAKMYDTKATNCAIKLTDTIGGQVANLVPITSSSNADDYSYLINSLNGYNTADSSILIWFPEMQSGRCMISANYKLYMPTTQAKDGTWSFQAPAAANSTDPNNDIIYDKFEFTFDSTKTFWVNSTAVDFFAIPTTLKCERGSSGNVNNLKRDSLISTAQRWVSTYGNGLQTWESTPVKVENTVVRFDAPTTSEKFDKQYLKIYIDTLINYYKTNTLYIDCSELDAAGDEIFDHYKQWDPSSKQWIAPMPNGYPGLYTFGGSINAEGKWVFTNSPSNQYGQMADTIDMTQVNTTNFFGPGTSPFDTQNKTVKSVLVKYITAAFTVNMLPTANGDTLKKSFFNKNSFYLPNKYTKLSKDTAYYNVYTRAMHKTISSMYAFAYDDVLGQDGSLSTNNPADTVFVTIGSFGNVVVPVHQNALPVSPVTVTYNSGFLPKGNDSLVCTVKWTVPNNQPINASYFIMLNGKGSGYAISSAQVIEAQEGKFFTSQQTSGTLTLSSTELGSKDPAGIWVQVMTVGGPNCSNTLPPSELLSCSKGSDPCQPTVAKKPRRCLINKKRK